MDPRVGKFARLLTRYSLGLKRGQLVKIQGEIAALPLIEAVFAEAIDIGAHPYTDIVLPSTQEIFLKNGSPKQLEYLNPIGRHEVLKIDALVHVWASQNTRFLAGVDPRRQATAHKARRPLIDRLFARIGKGEVSWVGTQFPTHADAQEANMSLTDYEDFVYAAGHLNSPDPVKHWRKVEKELIFLIG